MRVHAKTKVIERWQHGHRSYATERLADGRAGYVALPVDLLKRPSDEVALVAVILLSPRPISIATACARIGITSSNTRTRLLGAIKDVEAVAIHRGARGEIFVARGGTDFSVLAPQSQNAKNDTTKNDTTKIDTAHSYWKKDILDGSESNLTENPIDTQARVRASGKDEKVEVEVEFGRPGPMFIQLADWRRSIADDVDYEWVLADIDYGWWRWKILEASHVYGIQLPKHLDRPEVAEQVASMVGCLGFAIAPARIGVWHTNSAGQSVSTTEILDAVIRHLGQAHADGKKIRSLGFVAKALLGQIRAHDFREFWAAQEVPRFYDEAERLAPDLLALLPADRVDEHHLTTPRELAVLASMLDRYDEWHIEHAVLEMPLDAENTIMTWGAWNLTAQRIAKEAGDA
jgi:hypothetical protein